MEERIFTDEQINKISEIVASAVTAYISAYFESFDMIDEITKRVLQRIAEK